MGAACVPDRFLGGRALSIRARIALMEVYLVGGAVRDELLGLPVNERDWCVVGATPDDLVQLGYRPVGKDFPVFIHPQSGEEYALARTERKTSAGYHGFSFHTSPAVTIAEDLGRRDLTVNAMARDSAGNLIDPFNGRADIEKKTLRHVSVAFAEDPVRILRTAKFAARLHDLGFRIADDTVRLMQQMVANGEADALVSDRVWKETEAALAGPDPRVYFEALRECGALAVLFAEIDALFGVPQPAKWHPEIDTGLHTMMVLEQAAMLSGHVDVRFAALVHDLGKGTTPKSELPSHKGHELRGAKLVKSLAKRLPVPNACRDLGSLVAEYHAHCHRAFELRPETILKVLDRADAFRRPQRFENFLLSCEADSRGRTGLESDPYPQADFFRAAFTAAKTVEVGDITNAGLTGADIGREISSRRLHAITKFKRAQDPPK